MREAALRWLDRLDDEQLAAALRPFDDEAARRDWSYLPGGRRGVALADMTRGQAKAAHRLLATGLSRHAFAQAATIVGLEDVLDELEGGGRERHRGDYWLVIFGDPGRPEPWTWRFEGHHVSVTHTVVDGGAVRGAPVFLGANPARVAHAGRSVLEPLGAEEHLAFELLHALPLALRHRAVVFEAAPRDILTGRAPDVGHLPDQGIFLAELHGEAAKLARRLVDLYLDRLPVDLAAAHRQRVVVDEIRFAWAGGNRPGEPHYYRLAGPRLLVELDNTQDEANHVHSVVRDPEGDFGADLLRGHVASQHQ